MRALPIVVSPTVANRHPADRLVIGAITRKRGSTESAYEPKGIGSTSSRSRGLPCLGQRQNLGIVAWLGQRQDCLCTCSDP
jgi:hypothetical protein